jgi:proteasome activator subunit 4
LSVSREKKKRKQNKDAASSGSLASEKPDPIYLTTIKMSACMILLFPYDLPKYLPTLITSFIRHSANPVMKDTIMKTIQDFKRTHQDRWGEFQLDFSREQLDDLQGAGAAHYFS